MRLLFVLGLFGLAACSGGGISDKEDRKIDLCVMSISTAQIIERSSNITTDDKDSYCKELSSNPTAFEELALRAVKDKLKDPYSAKFEDIKVRENSVSGKVNAKNSYGAYGGSKRFRLEFEDGKMKFYLQE